MNKRTIVTTGMRYVLVVLFTIMLPLLAGCAAEEDGEGEEVMKNRLEGPVIDNAVHNKIETATFSMG